MKKLKTLALASLIGIGSLFSISESAEASTIVNWSPWKSVTDAGIDCKVRIGTDAYTYTTGATTVDYQIQSNGKCSRLYYKAFPTSDIYQLGYFSYNTPIKSFLIDAFAPSGRLLTTMDANLYTDSARTDYAGLVSTSITIYN
ncbi:hypothetical protein HP456_12525 [Bacillus haikouensis]|jgi:hypothetical protein|uniref:hypothetical protein n=1 Tax=Bacillus haikouensis TaxID=1510468 RepID=UPI0015518E01|nr:hypothetical protein [Bacillus haikouensis]NQD66745.1 hypothetical protein [Bacillus haikouensis]